MRKFYYFLKLKKKKIKGREKESSNSRETSQTSSPGKRNRRAPDNRSGNSVGAIFSSYQEDN